MKFSDAKRVLVRNLPVGLPVLLTGAPGVGKTDLVHSAKDKLGWDLQISHPVVEDPTDVKGFPFAQDGKAGFLPYGHLATALAATKPLLWFLDDLGQASPAVQAAYMQLLLLREVGGHKLPDCVRLVAATNRKQDRAGVSGMLEPVKSRFATIINVEADLDGWIDWALLEGLPYEVIAFMQLRGKDLLHVHKPTSDMVNGMSPRTWHNAALLYQAGLDESDAVNHEVFAGAVGSEGAVEFLNSLKFLLGMPSVDDVRLNPEGTVIPTEPSTLWALCTAIASEITPTNFAAYLKYATRMAQEGQGDFATYLVKKAVVRTPTLTSTKAYTKALTGPIFSDAA